MKRLPLPAMRISGLVALAVIALSACGGGNAYVGDNGEELKIGETVSVEVDTDTASGPLDVTLESIEAGDEADLEPLAKYGVTDGTPYYLTFTLENTDGSAFAGTRFGGADLGLANGLDGEGTAMSSTTTDDAFEPCPYRELSREFDEPGATQEVCVLVLGKGQEVVGANYIPAGIDSTTVWLP